MIFSRLELFRFKRFKHAHIDFKPGLNVVQGPNEAGKSSLRVALMAVLFGNPTSSSEVTQSWTTWGEPERCELRLEYGDQQGSVCQLRKDFAQGKIFLVKEEETYRTAKTIQNMITDELGISSEEFYNLCSSLDVRSLANLGSTASRKEIGKMLAGLMSGTGDGQDCTPILRKLDEAAREISKGLRSASKIPGPLKASRERLIVLVAQRTDLKKKVDERQSKIAEYEAIRTAMEKNKKRLADLDHLLEANGKLSAAEKRRAELLEQDSQFDRSQSLRQKNEAEHNDIRRQLKDAPAACYSAEEIQELQNLMHQKATISAVPASTTADKPQVFWLYAGLGLLVFSVVGIFFHWKVFGLMFLTGVAGVLIGWRQRENWRRKETERCRTVNLQEKALADCENRIRQLLAKAGSCSAEDILKSWPQAQKNMAQAEALQRQLHTLQPVNEDRWRSVRSELRLTEDTLNDPEMAPLRLDPQSLAERQRERRLLADQIAASSEQQSLLKAWLRQDAGSNDQLSSVDEEIDEIKERLQSLEQREKILRMTYDFLERARRATLNPAREVLEQAGGSLFRRLSADRYEKIMVNDEDLASRIFSRESGKWEDPAILSQGAFDQFYLSLRLALCDILSAGKRPPLLLDEPFAAFDPERQRLAQELLRELAAERQILLFTCRHDYDRIADHLIELAGPDAPTRKSTGKDSVAKPRKMK